MPPLPDWMYLRSTSEGRFLAVRSGSSQQSERRQMPALRLPRRGIEHGTSPESSTLTNGLSQQYIYTHTRKAFYFLLLFAYIIETFISALTSLGTYWRVFSLISGILCHAFVSCPISSTWLVHSICLISYFMYFRNGQSSTLVPCLSKWLLTLLVAWQGAPSCMKRHSLAGKP